MTLIVLAALASFHPESQLGDFDRILRLASFLGYGGDVAVPLKEAYGGADYVSLCRLHPLRKMHKITKNKAIASVALPFGRIPLGIQHPALQGFAEANDVRVSLDMNRRTASWNCHSARPIVRGLRGSVTQQSIEKIGYQRSRTLVAATVSEQTLGSRLRW
ncbi:hypothetical protein F9C07_2103264 [Aspergillus flavus]|uniref:Uncharacterized protein n=1 Tax=Aspergillus flavus (strain ATCC 200026 / FGSC A1120 / IAM 13836 / NRRL 3357 / JCM 12722 / SRRC 167) TaxID=332952 RepID=A0A7U2R0D2_ASPFN|nr:hypothetical protein F9C07_2103264 [Aspergillus flavus]